MPSTVISAATGIMDIRPRKMIQWTSKLTAVDTAKGDLGDFTAYGVRGNVSQFRNSSVLAQFSDGSAAILQNPSVGKGSATHFAFLPGIRFRNQNPYRADPHFNSLTNYTDGSLPYVLRFLNESGVAPRVVASATQVETPLLTIICCRIRAHVAELERRACGFALGERATRPRCRNGDRRWHRRQSEIHLRQGGHGWRLRGGLRVTVGAL